MKNKNTLFFLFFLLMLFSVFPFANAQSVIISETNGNEFTEALNLVQKITFSDNYLIINNWDSTSEEYNISEINKVYFSGLVVSSSTLPAGNISLFPNPVNTIIYMKNVPEEYQDISIFRIDGTKVMNVKLESGNNSFSVQNLNNGLYLLIINNHVLKFIKQ